MAGRISTVETRVKSPHEATLFCSCTTRGLYAPHVSQHIIEAREQPWLSHSEETAHGARPAPSLAQMNGQWVLLSVHNTVVLRHVEKNITNVNENKPDSERQLSHLFSYVESKEGTKKKKIRRESIKKDEGNQKWKWERK